MPGLALPVLSAQPGQAKDFHKILMLLKGHYPQGKISLLLGEKRSFCASVTSPGPDTTSLAGPGPNSVRCHPSAWKNWTL